MKLSDRRVHRRRLRHRSRVRGKALTDRVWLLRRNALPCCRLSNSRGWADGDQPMKSLMMGMMGAGVAMMLLLPAASYAGQQKTEDQASFQNNVKALPSTHK